MFWAMNPPPPMATPPRANPAGMAKVLAHSPAGEKGGPGSPDVMKGLNPVNRQSAADSSETVIEEYNDRSGQLFQGDHHKAGETSQ